MQTEQRLDRMGGFGIQECFGCTGWSSVTCGVEGSEREGAGDMLIEKKLNRTHLVVPSSGEGFLWKH